MDRVVMGANNLQSQRLGDMITYIRKEGEQLSAGFGVANIKETGLRMSLYVCAYDIVRMLVLA